MTPPPTVLVVDDEELFLRTALDGFADSTSDMTVLTAKNGRLAAQILDTRHVDLVVTDLKMPEMDGYGLLSHMSRHHPGVPAIVMTAFGTPEIESRLREQGVTSVLDKPFDFPRLRKAITDSLSAMASGHLTGISLATFLQMIQIERKTCAVRVGSREGQGLLHFRDGQLIQAETGETSGDAAALAILAWGEPVIEFLKVRTTVPGQAMQPLQALLMEAYRLKDESHRPHGTSHPTSGAVPLSPEDLEDSPSPQPPPPTLTSHKEPTMAAADKLKELAQIDGFAGCGLFTPTGEALAMLGAEGVNLKDIGVLANNVLMNAQKASLDMGTGRGQQVHVEAEHAHILVRCLNEGTDPLRSQPGKAHIHLVLILKSDSSIGMAKLKINSVIAKLADDFRA
ncbi:response regulator [Geothrix oryzisoli]|uniref:response regulator n=1 Tax=Geothrix oryzisoli TaxID=2922721 RepID=UPI001FACFABA|nr:response regulator [Geothrix oryzisoli]